MKQRLKYVAPELTVVQFVVERGYANSITEVAEQINWMVQMETTGEAVYTDEGQTMETDRDLSAGYWGGGGEGTWF